MRRNTVVVVGALAMSLLTGCTGGGQDPAGLSTVTAPPSASAEPTPTPTPTGPVDRSDEAAGIVFKDLPDVTGDALKALDTLTLYELKVQQSTTSGVLDPSLQIIAAPDLVDRVAYQLQQNQEKGWTVGGVMGATVTIVDADAYTAHATVCHDLAKVTLTNAGVEYTAAETGRTDRTLHTVVMSRVDDSTPWAVESYEKTGTC